MENVSPHFRLQQHNNSISFKKNPLSICNFYVFNIDAIGLFVKMKNEAHARIKINKLLEEAG